MTSSFLNILIELESILAKIYGFDLSASVSEHLIHERDMETYPEIKISSNNAQILLDPGEKPEDDLYISFYCPDKLCQKVLDQNPLTYLSNENLNAFLIIIEEISHFHLILNRAADRRLTTKLELEWQAEIDKVLLSAVTMRRQSGDSHFLPLSRQIFEESTIHSSENHYWEATRFAAKFWYKILSHRDGIYDPENSNTLRTILSNIYRKSWSEKMQDIETSAFLKL